MRGEVLQGVVEVGGEVLVVEGLGDEGGQDVQGVEQQDVGQLRDDQLRDGQGAFVEGVLL